MITVAHLMAQAALARTESRGTHLRTDYPRLDEANWHRQRCYLPLQVCAPAASCICERLPQLREWVWVARGGFGAAGRNARCACYGLLVRPTWVGDRSFLWGLVCSPHKPCGERVSLG